MNTHTTPASILCVCLGNICRSPTAEAVFRQHIHHAQLNIQVDSAGTSANHAGEPPDPRSQAHAKKRGVDLSRIRSRQVTEQDFYDFELILAMDTRNLNHLQAMHASLAAQHEGSAALAEVQLLSAKDTAHKNQPLPDPYYGGYTGFELVLDRCESAVQAWLADWQQR